jgi:hypothetical protein
MGELGTVFETRCDLSAFPKLRDCGLRICSVPANTTVFTRRDALEWCDEFILFNLVPGERTVKSDTQDGT